MKHSLDTFTRGTQLLGHFGFMFAAGFKLPLVVSVLVVLATVWWRVSSMLTDYQAYLLWMHVYASAYGFMEFDPDKLRSHAQRFTEQRYAESLYAAVDALTAQQNPDRAG